MLYMLKISEWNDTEPGGGGRTSIYTYAGCAIFQGIFQHKFLNCVLKLIRNSKAGYDYFSRTEKAMFLDFL